MLHFSGNPYHIIVFLMNRGEKVLIHNGFKYQKNRQRTESIYWRCWRKECKAKLRTNIFDLNNMNPNTSYPDAPGYPNPIDIHATHVNYMYKYPSSLFV
jgi:hypothetical protein